MDEEEIYLKVQKSFGTKSTDDEKVIAIKALADNNEELTKLIDENEEHFQNRQILYNEFKNGRQLTKEQLQIEDKNDKEFRIYQKVVKEKQHERDRRTRRDK
jgi:hypothetical protein